MDDDYYKKLVKEYEFKEKKKKETFRKWRLKNLEKHRTYMREYHRRGKKPPRLVKETEIVKPNNIISNKKTIVIFD